MSLRHHPADDLLLDYAAGRASSAVALIVATHLWFCPACRRTVALAEGVGGALLDGQAQAQMAPGALDAVLARLDAGHAPSPVSRDGTPLPLHVFLGGDLSSLRWRALGPSLGYVPLARQGGTAIRLLRGAPGADTGRHDHRGMEFTLVLSGGFTDETGSYGPGDFQTAAPGLAHNPVADPGADCINLSVTTGPLRFEGLVQKIAGKLFGF